MHLPLPPLRPPLTTTYKTSRLVLHGDRYTWDARAADAYALLTR